MAIRALGKAELLKDARDVLLQGSLGDDEVLRDALIRACGVRKSVWLLEDASELTSRP